MAGVAVDDPFRLNIESRATGTAVTLQFKFMPAQSRLYLTKDRFNVQIVVTAKINVLFLLKR
jgi:hypothetical protein